MNGFLLAILFLFGGTLTDVRSRRIDLRFTAAFALLGSVFCTAAKRPLMDLFPGMIPGLLVMALSVMSRGKVGFGDGIALCVTAFFMESTEFLECAAVSSLLAFAVSAVLFCRKRSKDAAFPFLPCLLGGAVITFAAGLNV